MSHCMFISLVRKVKFGEDLFLRNVVKTNWTTGVKIKISTLCSPSEEMLTPRFTLEQDDRHVTVSIYAPFTHISETEVFMDGRDFRFFSKPYFLRLHFPSEVTENDDASAKFDADSCSYIIKCPKVTKGEHFPNLDLISELVKPKGSTNVGVSIESLDEEPDWYIEQEFQDLPSYENRLGFGLKHHNVFNKLLEECQEILDVKTPEKFSIMERKQLRLAKEAKDFDPDHYLCDLFEPDAILKDVMAQALQEIPTVLSADENLKLAAYTKSVKIPSKLHDKVLYGLLDILFGYCYDRRTTFGEHSSESGWLISKLSSTLVCSDVHEDSRQCVISSLRRSLIYPLYRQWSLSLKVLEDVHSLLKLGKVAIIHCLIDLMQIFVDSEGRYLFNQLYIENYLCWIQGKVELDTIAEELLTISKEISKSEIGLDLDELEAAAKLVQSEQVEAELAKDLNEVNLTSTSTDSDDSDNSDSSDNVTETESETDTDTETESNHPES